MPTAVQVYRMLGNENLWQVASNCQQALTEANIPYSVCGGVAVLLHGYQRNTVGLNLIIRNEDSANVRSVLQQAGMEWSDTHAEFRSPRGVAVQFLIAGERAGRDSPVRLPDPHQPETTELRDGLPVVRLSRLIEMKIPCGLGNIRRTHKDFADVASNSSPPDNSTPPSLVSSTPASENTSATSLETPTAPNNPSLLHFSFLIRDSSVPPYRIATGGF